MEGLEGPEVVEQHVAVSSLAKSAAVVHGWNEPGQEQRASLQIFMLELRPEQLARIVEAQESGELKAGASVEDCRGYLAGLSDPLDES
ncbi:MAG: hypothetical protein WB586_07330 [Chthoniobacterales bacterium]